MSRSDPSPVEAPQSVGAALIAEQVRTMPASPGVYRMLGERGDVLYVGKAKDLKKRVAAYTRPERQTIRIQRMIARTRAMEVVTTHTEAEALLLEANLIKSLAPRYNILLRDDKSFPSILLTGDHDYPQVLKHRGAHSRPGQYFGPFASAWAVNQTLTALQRAFLLRTCSDAVFASRTRPCLLHQIKRCSAPCVERISQDDYAALVEQARAFLTGRSQEIRQQLAARMEEASEALDFEKAAEYRDRIRAMAGVLSRQDIHVPGLSEADVIAAHSAGEATCIQVFFYRSGANYGSRAYYPAHARDAETAEVLEAFIGQFYANKQPPRLLLLSHTPPERTLLAEALAVKAGYKVEVAVPRRGPKCKLVEHARTNAQEALGRRLAESATQRRLLDALAETLGLDGVPERIEVYDNSHVQGSDPVGAMIVAGPEGFVKQAYRKFNIKDPDAAGDDFAMMREVLTRRFARAQKEDPERTRGQWPDLVLIDGGKGQLSAVASVLADLGIEDVALCAVAKGPDRNAGRERLFVPGRTSALELAHNDPVLYFIQRLRDEAHRFAIGTHRARRSKGLTRSALDDVPGIGARRKRALLHHFGSAKAVGQAGLADLEAVEGISRAIARRIYDHFHPAAGGG